MFIQKQDSESVDENFEHVELVIAKHRTGPSRFVNLGFHKKRLFFCCDRKRGREFLKSYKFNNHSESFSSRQPFLKVELRDAFFTS
jgi:hypothetical protein